MEGDVEGTTVVLYLSSGVDGDDADVAAETAFFNPRLTKEESL